MHVRQRKRIWKIGLHPLVRPHSGQAEQEMLGRYSALWLEEREEHQSPWCMVALLQAFSLGVYYWPARFVIKNKWKGHIIHICCDEKDDSGGEKKWWRKQRLKWSKPLTDVFLSSCMDVFFVHMFLQQQELWSLFITPSSISLAAGSPSTLPLLKAHDTILIYGNRHPSSCIPRLFLEWVFTTMFWPRPPI